MSDGKQDEQTGRIERGIEMLDEKRISETCMVISLRVSQWTGRKKDKKVSAETNQTYNAEQDAGAFYKMLLPDLKQVQQTVNQARASYYHRTAPWNDNGDRIVSVLLYDDLVKNLRQHQRTFEKQIQGIADEYQVKIFEQQARLGQMFSASDYPTLEDFLSRFGFRWFLSPLPVSDDIRFKVSEGEKERLKEESRKALEASLQSLIKDTWERLHKVVKHCAEKLGDDKGIFRDTLIGNVQELVDVIPGLNFLNDPELERLRKEVKGNLCAYDPVALRTRKAHRRDAAKDAKEILGKIESVMPSIQVQSIAIETQGRMNDIAEQARKFDSFM